MTVTLYEVGGCVRDEILGVPSKDIDYTAEAASFDVLRDYLIAEGFKIFVETPEFLTIRARFPGKRAQTADFVLARKEGVYTDGRRPDTVVPGTIYDDLARRDFTMNAIAKDSKGNLIDPFGGTEDLAIGLIRCVGRAEDRIREDSLRALRAIRFAVTKGFDIDMELWDVINSDWLPPLLSNASVDRRRDELAKAFKHDTVSTLRWLGDIDLGFVEAVFENNLWLEPTTKG